MPASLPVLHNGLQFVLQHRDVTGAPRCRGFVGLTTTSAPHLRSSGRPPRSKRSWPTTSQRRCRRGEASWRPVTSGGATAAPLPPSLRNRNAIPWSPGDHFAASRVVERAGIASSAARLFLSYVRKDTSELADQLFDALHRQGFDVFLDVFRIPPGADFHVRLAQELSDKAVVLVLESPNTHSSKWVRHEIGFARANRLGVVALRLPGARAIREIEKGWRRTVTSNELMPTGRLKPGALRHIHPVHP